VGRRAPPAGCVRLSCACPSGCGVLWCPADVISIPKTDENFRLLYDVKGRFVLHRITMEEAKVQRPPHSSLCRWSPRLLRLPPSSFVCVLTCACSGGSPVAWVAVCVGGGPQYKLCRVKTQKVGDRGIPYITTNDGRTHPVPGPAHQGQRHSEGGPGHGEGQRVHQIRRRQHLHGHG